MAYARYACLLAACALVLMIAVIPGGEKIMCKTVKIRDIAKKQVQMKKSVAKLHSHNCAIKR